MLSERFYSASERYFRRPQSMFSLAFVRQKYDTWQAKVETFRVGKMRKGRLPDPL